MAYDRVLCLANERLLAGAMRRHPDIVGLYNAGAAHQAVLTVLRDRAQKPSPAFVGHELTAETRAMLRDRTMTRVIDQDPLRQAQHAIDILSQRYGYLDQDAMSAHLNSVPFTLHGPFNVMD